MAEGLALEHDCRGEALVAHALWEGFVVGALVVDLVAELLDGHAVLALLVGLVLTFALGLHLGEEVLETLVLKTCSVLSLDAVGAFLMGSVLAVEFDFLHLLLRHAQAVYALCIRTMTTM